MQEIKISFSASGWVTQTLLLEDNYDPDQLATLLNQGELMTTIQEGGQIEETATGKVVAQIIGVDNNLTYEDFEINET